MTFSFFGYVPPLAPAREASRLTGAGAGMDEWMAEHGLRQKTREREAEAPRAEAA